jgi:hypothetical protein
MTAQRRLVAAVGMTGMLVAHVLDEARALPGVHEEHAVVEQAGGAVLWLVLAVWLVGLGAAHLLRRTARRPQTTTRLVWRLTAHSAGLLLAVEVGARVAAGLEPLEPEELIPLSGAVTIQLLIALVVALLLALPGVLLARWARPGRELTGAPAFELPQPPMPARLRSSPRYTRYLGRAPPGDLSAIH